METTNNNKPYTKLTRANMDIFITKYRSLKTHLLLYFFITLEWIIRPLKYKESRYTNSIGLS